MSSPSSVPDWAGPGRYRPARWDGGPIEADKGRLSGWPGFAAGDEQGVLAATRDWYNPRTVEFLKAAHINWAWLTWSVGFSRRTEEPHWKLVRQYIEECHRSGIRVAAYLSIANMFWADMFENVPGSRDWVERLADGSPRFYSRPHRYMARITHPGWLEYVRMRVREALDAGADSFWIDNTFAYHGEENVRRLLEMIHGEAAGRGRKAIVMSNYNRGVYRWARLQNGVTTEDGQEPGWYGGKLVTNAGLLRYQYAVSEGWRPVSVEYGGRHAGERFTTPMEPRKWQLSIAECAAFQAGFEPFFEGAFLTGLYRGDPSALEKLRAIGKYNAFLQDNEQYYRDVRPAARMAVFAESDKAVAGLNALAARNAQFEVVFSREQERGNPGDAALSVESPPNVLWNVVRQQGRLVLHLLNYADEPVRGLRVRLREPARTALLLSPDFESRKLRVSRGTFEIPRLDTYNLVVIQ